MVIVASSGMFLHQILDFIRAEIGVDKRVFILKIVLVLSAPRSLKPAVYHVDSKAAFLSGQDGCRKEIATNLAVEPLLLPHTNLELRAKRLDIFHHFPIQK